MCFIFLVWHCANSELLEVVKNIATQYDTTDQIAGQLALYLNKQDGADWSIFCMAYSRIRGDWTPGFNNNSNFCHVARLDVNILVMLARVYKE